MPVKNKIIFCHKCKRDLRLTTSKKVSNEYKKGLEAIKWFQDGLKNGYFFIGDDKVNSLVVFKIYTHIRYLINRQKNIKLDSFPMLYKYKVLCKKLQHYNSKKCGPIYKDYFLTIIVYHLFLDYPNNLQRFAHDNNLTHRDFVHGFKDIPFWYENKIDNIILIQNTIGREISESEIRGVINYLKRLSKKITQESVAEIIGCHSTINKGFVRAYKKLLNNITI